MKPMTEWLLRSRSPGGELGLRISCCGSTALKTGPVHPGRFSCLERDSLKVPADEIQDILAAVTIGDDKIVYGSVGYRTVAPPVAPAVTDWRLVSCVGCCKGRRSAIRQRYHVWPRLAAVRASALSKITLDRRVRSCRSRTRARSGSRSADRAGRSSCEIAVTMCF